MRFQKYFIYTQSILIDKTGVDQIFGLHLDKSKIVELQQLVN